MPAEARKSVYLDILKPNTLLSGSTNRIGEYTTSAIASKHFGRFLSLCHVAVRYNDSHGEVPDIP
jgi:hypothetical protein